MNLRAMPTGDLIYVLEQMLIKHRSLWESAVLLAVWLDIGDQVLRNLKTAAAVTRPEPTDPNVAQQLDRAAEAAARFVFLYFQVAEAAAQAQGDPERAAAFAETQAGLFPQGLSFVRASYTEQVGATSRLVTMGSDPAVQALFGDSTILGLTFGGAVAHLAAANEALRGHITPPAEPAAAPPRPMTLNDARLAALSFLSDVLPSIDRAYPATDLSAATSRRLLLGELTTRSEAAAAKARAARAKAASTPAPAPTPAAPPAPAPTAVPTETPEPVA